MVVHWLVLGCVLLGLCYWRAPVSLANPCLVSVHPTPLVLHVAKVHDFLKNAKNYREKYLNLWAKISHFLWILSGIWSKWHKSNDYDTSHPFSVTDPWERVHAITTRMAGEEAGLRGGAMLQMTLSLKHPENTRRNVSERGETWPHIDVGWVSEGEKVFIMAVPSLQGYTPFWV